MESSPLPPATEGRGKKRRFFVVVATVLSLLTLGSLLQSHWATTTSLEFYQGMLDDLLQVSSTVYDDGEIQGRVLNFSVGHRPEVQEALKQINVGTPSLDLTKTMLYTESTGANLSIDLTQNFPRIEDYAKQYASPIQRNIIPNLPRDDGTNQAKDDDPLNIVLFYADDWTMKVRSMLQMHDSLLVTMLNHFI
jgi:hypothetical protein